MSAVKHNVADIVWKSPGSEIQPLSLMVWENISEPYRIEVEVKCPNPDLSFSDMLHTRAELVLKCGPELDVDRSFAGIITRFSQGRTRHGNLPNASKPAYVYHVEIRPKLWLLTRNVTTRVFQKKTVQDIVDEVIDGHGVKASWELSGSLPEREYCLQYEESDYQFISRLLEDEGVCFYFDQANDKVIFSNHPGGHTDCQPTYKVPYVEEISPRMAVGKKEFISDFTYEETVSTGMFTQQHYNYETSQTNITADDQETKVPNFKSLEHYDHTQNYVDKPAGKRLAGLRKEEHVTWGKTGRGRSSSRSLEVGYTFDLKDHFRSDLNVKWLLVGCVLEAQQGNYSCSFVARPASIPFRPKRKTRRPRVAGLQTATVTGPSGSKVYLDDLGRCKLQFHWDREGGKDDRSSMWVRLSNNYAGKDYGIQWIPRVGHEVLVTFIDGDPDLPLVTGRVYNDFNTPPLGPSKKWQNIIKTIKDNHLMFDDEDGKELVDIRAQKDMNRLIINNCSASVGANKSVSVGNDHSIAVDNNETHDVGVDHTQTVGSNQSITVGSNRSLQIGSNDTVAVSVNRTTSIGINESRTIGASATTTVTANKTVTVGSNHTQECGGTHAITAGSQLAVNTPTLAVTASGSFKIDTGGKGTISTTTATLSGKGSVKIQCGGASISMSPASISINAPSITLAGGTVTLTGLVKHNC